MVRITRNELGDGMAGRIDGGAGVIDFPTNGTLMTGEQMDALIEHVQTQGTPVECGMLIQINALVNGTHAYLRTIRQETDCRHKAENQVRDMRSALAKMRMLLNATNGKTAKPKLLDVVQQVMDEIDVFEVAEIE